MKNKISFSIKWLWRSTNKLRVKEVPGGGKVENHCVMMFRFNYMMLTVLTALSVPFLSNLTVSLCDLCKTVFGGLEIWVIYNSFYKGVASIKTR